MTDIDFEALGDSRKALVIIFILLIILVNAFLILKTVRTERFLYRPKCLTLISLAIGDIFLALFSLVIDAILYFETDEYLDLPCSTRISGNVYQGSLLHFVYGIGLIMLTVEFMLRSRKLVVYSKSLYTLGMSVLFSATPWFLGLIIVLPLRLEGFDWDACAFLNPLSVSRQRAVWVIPIVVPACAALITSIVMFLFRALPNNCNTTDGEMTTSLVDNSSSQNPNTGTQATHSPSHSEYPQSPMHDQPGQLQHIPGQLSPSDPFQYNNHQMSRNRDDPEQYYNIPQMPTTIPYIELISGTPDYDIWEKRILLLTSIIFFFCVMPGTCFWLHMQEEKDPDLEPLVETILANGFHWLFIFRSVVTPIIWLISSSA